MWSNYILLIDVDVIIYPNPKLCYQKSVRWFNKTGKHPLWNILYLLEQDSHDIKEIS